MASPTGSFSQPTDAESAGVVRQLAAWSATSTDLDEFVLASHADKNVIELSQLAVAGNTTGEKVSVTILVN